MASSRDRRLAKELQDIQADKDNSGVYAAPNGNDLTSMKGTIPGPPDTPYEGGTYEVTIEIPDTYPFKAPAMQFSTKVWHPNISSQTGAICLDTLRSNWSPVQTIKTALLSIRLLLECPNPSDPQDAQVAAMMRDDLAGFMVKAQEWAVRYAGAPKRQLDLSKYTQDTETAESKEEQRIRQYRGYNPRLVDEFTTMGFEVPAVVDVLVSLRVPVEGDYLLGEGIKHAIIERLLQHG